MYLTQIVVRWKHIRVYFTLFAVVCWKPTFLGSECSRDESFELGEGWAAGRKWKLNNYIKFQQNGLKKCDARETCISILRRGIMGLISTGFLPALLMPAMIKGN